MIINRQYILVGLTLALVLIAMISCCIGAVQISMSELLSVLAHQSGLTDARGFTSQQAAVLLNIRMPRVMLGVLIGAGLGISGAAIQGLFRNPLAEPGLIGISSGATLFAVMMIVLQLGVFKTLSGVIGTYALSLVAFIGAGITTMTVYRLSVTNGKASATTLLLSGIAINALAGAITGLLTYLSTEEQLRTITFWSLGSLGGASWQTVTGLLPFILVAVLGLPFLGKSLNIMALGDSQALHMGIDIKLVKRLVIVLSTIAVGASVSVAGIIGFIGLIVPHILRIIFSADHRLVLPGSALAGAFLLSVADLLARTIVVPAELPIGILTALIGTPVFIYIIIRERKFKVSSMES